MQKFKSVVLVLSSFILAGCSGFTGLRAPLYDGQAVETDESAIETYHQSKEIVGDEKDYYFRYPMSEAIYEPSLTFTENEPVLLEEGVYEIGEDLPAGRVTLVGNESVFTSGSTVVHVGNLIIRDPDEMIYFENLFHSLYGQLVAQVDLISGHTIEMIGRDPELTVFYSEELPEDPYVLMDPPELLVNLDRLDVQQPLIREEENDSVQLTAGIYEVGEHLTPGLYEMKNVTAPHHTELIQFRAGEEPRVYELIVNREQALEEENLEEAEQESAPVIELKAGDKIYPNLVHSLTLEKVD